MISNINEILRDDVSKSCISDLKSRDLNSEMLENVSISDVYTVTPSVSAVSTIGGILDNKMLYKD